MIEFLDPRGEPAAPAEPYALHIDLRRGAHDVALLANGFFDSVAFLRALGQALAEHNPALRLHAYDKGNASITAPDDLLERISRECRAVITAYGH
jgi:hypothetical protein